MTSSEVPYGDAATRNRILEATWGLVATTGGGFKLADAAARAGVSRQAIYLHFGDRAGLLVALVQHMDDRLDLAESLTEIERAPDGAALLEALLRLNTRFWRQVLPVAQVLEAAQHDDDELGTAWRDRMQFRQATFRNVIETLADRGALDDVWTIDDAAGTLYGIAHFDTWRELSIELGWDDDRYVEAMCRVAIRSLLRNEV